MCRHALSYASKWSSGLIILVVINRISSKCIENAPPKPAPQPKPWIEEETEAPRRTARLHPHLLTPPPFPSGSFDSKDSDDALVNQTSAQLNNRGARIILDLQFWADNEGIRVPDKRVHKRQKRAHAPLRKQNADEAYDWNLLNPYDMGGRPPPGKTERRKRKTQEMAGTVIIRNKREVTPQISAGNKKHKIVNRVKRELDSYGYEEGNVLSEFFHPRIPIKNKTGLQHTLSSREGGFQTDVYYNDNPILESLVDYDDSKVRRMYKNDSSGEYVESDEGERDYLLNPLMTTNDDPFREFIYFSKVKKHKTTTKEPSFENDTSCFSFNSNSSAIEEDIDTVGFPILCETTNVLQRLMIEDDPHHYDSDFHIVTETLRKRNKRGDPKRKSFKLWMSNLVPEHAPHIEKMHDEGVDKLMNQKVHGMEKTYGDLFHEHQEKSKLKGKLHSNEHGLHSFKMHEDHEPHHIEMQGEHEPHHNKLHEGHEAGLHEHHEQEPEHHEPHHIEMHMEDHHDPHLEMHKEHDLHHKDIHGVKDEKLHHLDEAELEEHKKRAHIKLLEELYLKSGKPPHDKETKYELEKQEHEDHEDHEVKQAQTAAPVVQQQPQQQQQQYQQQQLYQQQQMYGQQGGQQYNNYNNYGGGGMGGMGGMGMNGMGGMGMNGMGGMGMNGMGGMGMNGMGMGQMGGMGAILNAIGNNLPKLSQTAAAQAPQNPNYPGQTPQNYNQPNYNQNYPQSPPVNAQDPNIQNAQDAAAAQQKAAQDQEAQVQQPDTQDSTAIQDNQDTSAADSSANVKAGDDASGDDIKADHSNDAMQPDDQAQSEDNAINAQQDNGQFDNEQNAQFSNEKQNYQFDNTQLGQYAPYAQNSMQNLAAAAG